MDPIEASLNLLKTVVPSDNLEPIISGCNCEGCANSYYINVKGESGRTYKIQEYGRVTIYEGEEYIGRACIIFKDNRVAIPTKDLMIAKYLLIKSNEREFLRVANYQYRTGYCHPVLPYYPIIGPIAHIWSNT